MRGTVLLVASVAAVSLGSAARADFTFSTNTPDGLMGIASRPDTGSGNEIEAADDFILPTETKINQATFTGLLPTGAPLSSITRVDVTVYRTFPKDSDALRTISVLTRANSPSDVDFDGRTSTDSSITFNTAILNTSFTAANSILNGIHPSPNQTTGGEGPITGEEVLFTVTFPTPIDLAADHYFFVPQVLLSTGNFFWLSASKPIVSPGTPFTPDLQAWARDTALDPDWLRAGTDIVGGATPPTFNESFSLAGIAVPEPAAGGLLMLGAAGMLVRARRRRG